MALAPAPRLAGDEPAAYSEGLGPWLAWLRRLLAWQVVVTRHRYGALADDDYRGLYIPDGEVDLLAGGSAVLPEELAAERRALAAERAQLSDRFEDGAEACAPWPLARVRRLFGLAPFELDVLVLALAPEIDLGFERLYAYIQDDVTRKRPSVNLALRLFCLTDGDRVAAREAFAPQSALQHHRLIHVNADAQRQTPLLDRTLKLDDRVVEALIGHDSVDPLLAPYAELTRPDRPLRSLVLPPTMVDQLRRWLGDTDGGRVLGVQGSYGSGRRAMAEALAAEAGEPLLVIDVERLVESDLTPVDAMQRVVREARLQRAALLWLGTRGLLEGEQAGWRAAFLAAVEEFPGRTYLPLDAAWEARGSLRRARYLRIEMPALSYAERERIWRGRLNGDGPDGRTIEALASTFRLSGGQVRDAVAMGRSLAQWRGERLSADDLYIACRAQSSGRLDALAHKIRPTYDWNDIVLPGDQLGQLREIAAQVRHRRVVLERWGFDRHLAMGKGLNVLFAGQSGTGKTMAAEIIAADLGLELFKVDLSSVVSKYIGETEKNLDRIFTAAREANAILFFDEADAIFGKRSEVKDAHDRYANIEVGYLLQKMEEYDGIVILATNLRKNLDDAFVRRLHAAIDFPFPQDADRQRIWQKVFPPEAPLAPDVDLAFLAKQFKLAGGNIRNIALLGAFLAAEDAETIEMRHLMRAVKREYQKMGRLVTEADFGRFHELVRGG